MGSILHVDRLSKSYEKSTALNDVSLEIEERDAYGIIGESGAGKSTLIRCLASLVKPTSGHIYFHGDDLAKMGASALRGYRRKIGMIFQHFNLLSSATVFNNVAYPLEISGVTKEKIRERVTYLLSLVGLSEMGNRYPSQLSGGEKQRVGIARALAAEPEILFCDEATSALDPKTTGEILRLLKKIQRSSGITLVLITHEMEVIKQICNKVAILEKGRILEKGAVIDIFSDPKHVTTKHLVESSHEVPESFFQELLPNQKLFRLRFKGSSATEPLISEIVRKFDVDINILTGWIDRIETLSLGTLIVQIRGEEGQVAKTLAYFQEKGVKCEALHPNS